MDNQHKKIAGYRDLTQSEIDGMNSIKALEAGAGELFKQIGQIEGVDPRLLALAKPNLRRGSCGSCARSPSLPIRSTEAPLAGAKNSLIVVYESDGVVYLR